MKTSQQTMRAALLAVFVAFLTFVSNVNAQLSEQSIVVNQMVITRDLTPQEVTDLPYPMWKSFLSQGVLYMNSPLDQTLSGAPWTIENLSKFQLTMTIGASSVRTERTDGYGYGASTRIDNTVNTPSMAGVNSFMVSVGIINKAKADDGHMTLSNFEINGVSVGTDPIVADRLHPFDAVTFTSEFGTVKPGDVFSLQVESFQPDFNNLNNCGFTLGVFQMQSIPEPSSVAVFLIGGAGNLIFRRKRT